MFVASRNLIVQNILPLGYRNSLIMRLRGIKLQGFRVFEELDWSFDQEPLFVFIGKNGSGKSAILDAIAIGLSHLTNRLSSKNKSYNNQFTLRQTDINIQAEECSVEIKVEFVTNTILTVTSSIKRGASGTFYNFSPEFELEEWVSRIKQNDLSSLPIAVYFSVDRANFDGAKSSSPKSLHNPYLYTYVDAFTRRNTSFTGFEQWFINEETIENQLKVGRGELEFSSDSLTVIRRALTAFFSSMSEQSFGVLRVARTNVNIKNGYSDQSGQYDAHLVIEKNRMAIPLASMSSGEKSVILLVVEIARRLYLANLQPDALDERGIVLIDEIELHLHPQWQRAVLKGLRETFPNVQFFVSTHSPQTLSSIHREALLEVEDGVVFESDLNPFGRDTNGILEEAMDTDKRPPEVDDLIDKIMAILFGDSANLAEAERMVETLKPLVATEDPILKQIEATFNRRKLLAK